MGFASWSKLFKSKFPFRKVASKVKFLKNSNKVENDPFDHRHGAENSRLPSVEIAPEALTSFREVCERAFNDRVASALTWEADLSRIVERFPTPDLAEAHEIHNPRRRPFFVRQTEDTLPNVETPDPDDVEDVYTSGKQSNGNALITAHDAARSLPGACLALSKLAVTLVLCCVLQQGSASDESLQPEPDASVPLRKVSDESTLVASSSSRLAFEAALAEKEREWLLTSMDQELKIQGQDAKIEKLQDTSSRGLQIIKDLQEEDVAFQRLLRQSRKQVNDLEQRIIAKNVQTQELQGHVTVLREEVARNAAKVHGYEREVEQTGGTPRQWYQYCDNINTQRRHLEREIEETSRTLADARSSLKESQKALETSQFQVYTRDRILEESERTLKTSQAMHARECERAAEFREKLTTYAAESSEQLRLAKIAEEEAKAEASRSQLLWSSIKDKNSQLRKENQQLAQLVMKKIPEDDLVQRMAAVLKDNLDHDEEQAMELITLQVQLGATHEQLREAHGAIAKCVAEARVNEGELKQAQLQIRELKGQVEVYELEIEAMREDVATAKDEAKQAAAETEKAKETAKAEKQQGEYWRQLVAETVEKQIPEVMIPEVHRFVATNFQRDLIASRHEGEQAKAMLERYKEYHAQKLNEYYAKNMRIEFDACAVNRYYADLILHSEQRFHQLEVAKAMLRMLRERFKDELRAEPLVIPALPWEATDAEMGSEMVAKRDHYFKFLTGEPKLRAERGDHAVYQDPRRIMAMYGYGTNGVDLEELQVRVSEEISRWSAETEERAAAMRNAEEEAATWAVQEQAGPSMPAVRAGKQPAKEVVDNEWEDVDQDEEEISQSRPCNWSMSVIRNQSSGGRFGTIGRERRQLRLGGF